MVGSIRRFEDLIAWQRARELPRQVYAATKDGAFARDIRLSSQIQSAAVFVMSNVAEGFERTSQAEFSQFLSVAKASCAEVRSQLYVALDAGYMDEAGFKNLYGLADEVARLLAGLRASVDRQRWISPGSK